MICEGVGGSLELREDCLVIRHTMVLGLPSHELGDEKRIPYSSISAVQFKRAGVLAGHIQFILGGVETTKGLLATIDEENSLFFSDNKAFEKARDLIETRLRDSRGYPALAPGGGASATEQLEKLASFLEMGLLTQQEFNLQKAALLNAPPIDSPSSKKPPEHCVEPALDPGVLRAGSARDRTIC